MATQCPKCHQWVDEDYICCADIEFQWKCNSCSKRTRGFAIPFGQCPLCGGKLERVDLDEHPSKEIIDAIQEAIQIEINAHHFYGHLAESTNNPQASELFKSLSNMERDHAEELCKKYHIDPVADFFSSTEKHLPELFFDDLGFSANTSDVIELYNCAIKLEEKAYGLFIKKSKALPEGLERDLYLELAAEEREHIALLESERDR